MQVSGTESQIVFPIHKPWFCDRLDGCKICFNNWFMFAVEMYIYFAFWIVTVFIEYMMNDISYYEFFDKKFSGVFNM